MRSPFDNKGFRRDEEPERRSSTLGFSSITQLIKSFGVGHPVPSGSFENAASKLLVYANHLNRSLVVEF